MLLGASLLGSMATIALGQDSPGAIAMDQAFAAGPVYLGTPAGYPVANRSCEGDCQVPWGTYSQGYLWENYCTEKRACRSGEVCRPQTGQTALFQPARPGHVSCATRSDRRSAARHRTLERERIICFDLFFELLGWNQCSCCVHSHSRGSRQQGEACCDQLPDSLPPIPVQEDEPHEATPPQADREVPDDGQQGAPEPAPEAAIPPIVEPGAQVIPPAAEPADEASPPPLDDAPPAVPRNMLPPTEPAPEGGEPSEPPRIDPSLSSTPLHGMVKVLVAERLSDYVKTR